MHKCVRCGNIGFYELLLRHVRDLSKGGGWEELLKEKVCEECGREIIIALREGKYKTTLEKICDDIQKEVEKLIRFVGQYNPEKMDEYLMKFAKQLEKIYKPVEIRVPVIQEKKVYIPVEQCVRMSGGKRRTWWRLARPPRTYLSKEQIEEFGLSVEVEAESPETV